MKTWEMIKELTENPEKEFETRDFQGNRLVAFVSPYFEDGDNVITTRSIDGEIIGLPLNDFMQNREWEEVRKPLSFIELLEKVKDNGDLSDSGSIDVEHSLFRRFESCNLYFILKTVADECENDSELAQSLLEAEWYLR